MYNEIIAALEEAAKDESAITAFTGKMHQKALKYVKVGERQVRPRPLCFYLLTCHIATMLFRHQKGFGAALE